MLAYEEFVEAFTGLHGAGRIIVPGPSSWRGLLEWRRSEAFGVTHCGGAQQLMHRDNKHVRLDPRGNFELIVPLAGQASMEQWGDQGTLRPGQMALTDVDRPFTFAHDATFRSISFIVPAHEAIGRSPAAARGPVVLDATGGLGRVVQQMARTLQEEHDRMTPATFALAGDRLLDLVGLVADGRTATAPAAHRETVEASIRQHVRRHAADHDLDVAAIARAIGWSPRYVQQILQATGTTPRDLIRAERLRLARTRLASPQWASSSIARIAYSCGFRSHATFATAFRHEFGQTPSETRNSGAGSPPSSSGSAPR